MHKIQTNKQKTVHTCTCITLKNSYSNKQTYKNQLASDITNFNNAQCTYPVQIEK